MWTPTPLLRPVMGLQQDIDTTVLRAVEVLTSLLRRDEATFHHVGSTALRPLLTRGIVDILVLTNFQDLKSLSERIAPLAGLLETPLPVLVRVEHPEETSPSLCLRYLLATRPLLLGEFLALQKRFKHEPGKKYPRAKQAFFAKLLGAHAPEKHESTALAFTPKTVLPHRIVLRTEYLDLRSPLSIDAPAYAHYLRTNPQAPHGSRIAVARELAEETWIEKFSEESLLRLRRQALTFVVRSTSNNQIIGSCHFVDFVQRRQRRCSVELSFATANSGRHHMSEALTAAVRYLRDNWEVHRVQTFYEVGDLEREALLRDSEFSVEGLAPAYFFRDGQWRDCTLAAIVL